MTTGEQRALLAIRGLKAKVERLEAERNAAIAVVGIGCRFPGGVSTPFEYWSFLERGGDGVVAIPSSRWDVEKYYDPDPSAAGKMSTRWGGLLERIDMFDAGFFDLTPREAQRLDPQHRLALEVSWEALEDAGVPADGAARRRVGVFFGVSTNDYFGLQTRDDEVPDVYTATGGVSGFLAGRISFLLNLGGPSFCVDSLCSSSLAALHLGCQSLRRRECDHALVGGVNVLAGPLSTILTSKFHALSPTGRVRAFDASADGFVRAEGCGVVVLRRLADAEAAGDTILAVVRGSAMNHGGRSMTMTAPNARAQQELIEDALASASTSASAVSFVETHGTGTPLGDPIEVEALAATYGVERPDQTRCALGAVKANLGHLEAASGIAGFIKVVLALRQRRIPQNINFERLNPRIQLRGTALYVPTASSEWSSAGPRVAAVSSFGMSGTNVHAILAEWITSAPKGQGGADIEDARAYPILLSGRTAGAVELQAGALAAQMDPGTRLRDVAFTRATRRVAFEHRLAVVARDRDEARAKLLEIAAGHARSRVRIRRESPRVALLFSGQGGQFTGMGRRLFETSDVFRDTVRRCDEVYREVLGREVFSAVAAGGRDAELMLEDTAFVQPALYALQCGLVDILEEAGIRPNVVLGHSVGELAAARAARVFSLEDGARLVAGRARVMGRLPRGGMVATNAAVGVVEPFIQDLAGVVVAAMNGRRETVIAGPRDLLEVAVRRLDENRVRTRLLAVSHAFHSPMMDPALDELEQLAAGIRLADPTLDFVSTVTGELVGTGVLCCARYWRDQARRPVSFAAALQRVVKANTILVEIGPKPVLAALALRETRDTDVDVLPSLRGELPEDDAVATLFGELHARGVPVQWERVFERSGARAVTIPTYPFERSRYWFAETAPPSSAPRRTIRHAVRWVPVTSTLAAQETSDWLVCSRAEDGNVLARELAQGNTIVSMVEDESSALRGALSISRPRSLVVVTRAAASSDDCAPEETLSNAVVRAEHVLTLLRIARESGVRKVWFVLPSSCAVVEGDGVRPEPAALWALLRCAALEREDQRICLVDANVDTAVEAASLARWLLGSVGLPEVAVRSGEVYAPQLVPLAPSEVRSRELSSRGTHVVVGGLGALGHQLARWLATRGARRIVLVGRTLRGDTESLIHELAVAEVEVVVTCADVCDLGAMKAVFESCDTVSAPVCGVYQLAGIATSSAVDSLEPTALSATLRPKLVGTLVLDRALGSRSVEQFVCFSSLSSVLGTQTLGAYAAANRAAEAVVENRRARGRTGLSISWGPWAGAGMALGDRASQARDAGLRMLEPRAAFDALEDALAGSTGHEVVVDAEWPVLAQRYASHGFRHLLGQVAPRPEPDVSPVATNVTSYRRIESAVDAVRSAASAVMGRQDVSSLSVDRGLFEAGMDSLMATELVHRLEVEVGVALSATLAMDHPTVRAIAMHLVAQVGRAAAVPEDRTAVRGRVDEPLAVVGLGCRLPHASDPEALWTLLLDGVDATSVAPEGRWTDTPSAPVRGAFLASVDSFDAPFFGISPREAQNIDPQQRLTLEVCWEALEHAGVPIDRVRGGDGGVFIGVSVSDYARGRAGDPAYAALGSSLNVVAGRVSYVLGWRGPSVAVDTACSSSLVAFHLACEALRAGDCSIALAGGVNLLLSGAGFEALTSARMLAPDGRCKTFDDAADGYARGEGCGIVVLKRLSDAESAGDRILAVVRASAVNQNGAGAGLTVPSSSAQEALYRHALGRAGLAAGDIDHVEAHGTGTSLGDPIEIRGIDAVYGKGRTASVIVSSVKTNIAHLEAAAGIAGVLKTVLSLNRETIPAHLHLRSRARAFRGRILRSPFRRSRSPGGVVPVYVARP